MCLLYCACHAKCLFPNRLQMSHACHGFWKLLQNPHVLLIIHKVHNPRHLPRKKDIWASNSAPFPLSFLHFWLGNGNALRATRKCTFSTSQLPRVGWHYAFWLGNVLRATTACTFSTSQLPKVVRSEGVLYILTSKCASRHDGLHFFISHLTTWLCTRRFSEPTFRPSGAQIMGKNVRNRDFSTFSRACILCLLALSLLWSSLFFSSLLFSDSYHLCLSICPYCRKIDF